MGHLSAAKGVAGPAEGKREQEKKSRGAWRLGEKPSCIILLPLNRVKGNKNVFDK